MREWMMCGLVAALAAAPAGATVRVWDGGGVDDNLSTAANWEGDEAPVSGDILVFRGNVRTTPVNDYDPETTVFETLVFSNTCASAAVSAPFTLSGNRIVLTGGKSFDSRGYAIYVAKAKSGQELTDTLNLDVTLSRNSAGTSKLGGYTMEFHHLVFKGAVQGDGGSLNSADQMHGSLIFEGPVTGFTSMHRPNGRGQIWLKSPDNVFTAANPVHQIREGSFKFDGEAVAGGSGTGFELGQANYDTPGKVLVNSAADVAFTGPLGVRGPNYRSGMGQLLNEVAGTTASFLGPITISTGHSTYGNSEGLGTGILVGGAGDGVLGGEITAPQTWLYKQGVGTWTVTGASSATGAVTVTAGTLLVNGDWSSTMRSKVSAGGSLGGTGRLGDVTFATSACLAVTNLSGGTALHIGTLNLEGMVTVDMLDVALPASGDYVALTFDAKTGSGSFVPGAGWPEGTSIALGTDALTVKLPAGLRTWTGAASSAWDFTSENWIDGLYADGDAVVFGDAAERTDVTVAQEVRPGSVMVSGTKDFTFTGAGIAGACSLEKGGTGVLVLANANTYAGDTSVKGGALQLDGSLAAGTVRIGANAAFTNTASGKLTGSCALVNEGVAELNGVNDNTGGVTLKGLTYVASPEALGAGDVTLGGTQQITMGNGGAAIGRGRTLYTEYADSSEAHSLRLTGGAFTWLGDVCIRRQRLFLYGGTGTSRFVFGEPGCDTVVRTEGIGAGYGGFYLRGSGAARFYSRIDFGETEFAQTDGNTIDLHASGNRWKKLTIAVGRVNCHAPDALAWGIVSMGQTYLDFKFHPMLDLDGYDQTIKELVMNPCIEASSQTVKSDAPATLTVSNDTDTVTARQQCRIEGAVTLRKDGTGTWSLGAANQTTGNVEVVAGTLKLTASDALPVGENSELTVASGAKVVLDSGVQASIAYTTVDGRPLKAGVYCGEGGTGTRLDAFFGPGAGSLTVTRGVNGLAIIFR